MRTSPFDLHRLRLLRELHHRGTIAAVAGALDYSPSSVSEQLGLLESEVGVPLLERVGRRVRLTEQAEILVDHTEAILARLDAAEADVAASAGEVRGRLRIAAFQTATLALVPPALARLRAGHPGLEVHVSQMEPEVALPGLAVRDFDLVIAEHYPGSAPMATAGLSVEDLLLDPLRLAVPAGMDVRASHAAAWVMEPLGTPAREWAMAACRAAGFEPDVRFETTDLLIHIRLVEQGLAVGFVPDLAWMGRAPTVRLLDLGAAVPARRVVTICREGRAGHPAIRACREALVRATRSIAP